VIAIALVLAAVFVPIAFLGGLTGQLYKQFALTIAVSVILSAILRGHLHARDVLLLLRRVEPGRGTSSTLGRFFASFNHGFERTRVGYLGSVGFLVRHAVLVAFTFIALLAATWGLIATRPTGLVPPEDQGYAIAVVSLPNGASLERTSAAMSQLSRIGREIPGVEGVIHFGGFNFLTGQSVSYNGTAFFRFKPWHERTSADQSVDSIVRTLKARLNGEIRDATVLVLNPPPIRGLGTGGGFTFVLQDRTGANTAQLSQVLQGILAEARKRKEIGFAYSGFDPSVPQIEYVVDREKVKALGVPLSDVFFTLQTFLGSFYVNDFNLFGRTYRVKAQAEGAQRSHPEDVDRFHVRSANGTMIPLSTLVSRRAINGPQYLERYNVYGAATINGANAPGYSSGQAIAAMEEIAAKLPPGFGYEWSEATYQERRPAGKPASSSRFARLRGPRACSALRELGDAGRDPPGDPIRRLRRLPRPRAALRSTTTFYTQVGLVMLVGLAAKNAILIVEFARSGANTASPSCRPRSMGAKLRLRPILMTSFAFNPSARCRWLFPRARRGGARRSRLRSGFRHAVRDAGRVFFIPVFYVMLQRASEGSGVQARSRKRPASERHRHEALRSRAIVAARPCRLHGRSPNTEARDHRRPRPGASARRSGRDLQQALVGAVPGPGPFEPRAQGAREQQGPRHRHGQRGARVRTVRNHALRALPARSTGRLGRAASGEPKRPGL
jgi:HAE1 family hydrophobic/amphiphilic exporter-1/multidrug efflux pump